MIESWLPVKDYYEGNYLVSNTGKVKNVRTGKIISQSLRVGYPAVSLGFKDNQKRVSVHRLVASAFLVKPIGKNIVVNHKDHDRTNNSISNLEWTTQQKNIQHAHKNGRCRDQVGTTYKQKKASSPYNGIQKKKNKFEVRFKINGKLFYGGRFDCEVIAYAQYLKLHKKFLSELKAHV